MPLYTFNFTSTTATGEARTFVQQIVLPDRPPKGARYFIRQVSALSTDTFANSFKWVNVYIPELMDITDQCMFQTYDIVNNYPVIVNTVPGFRFYLTDPVNTPLAFNTFPNINLGRHHNHFFTLTVQVTPYLSPTQLGKLYSFSVVIEWDTE